MNRLHRHLIGRILRSVTFVLAIIIAIGAGIQLVGQLEDVGTQNYGFVEAATYVALRMPRLAFETLPAAALLGALLALGNMAVHRELVVMRASGVSPFQMLLAVGTAGVALMLVMALLGESLAPSLGAYAREMRSAALMEEGAAASGQSAWLRDGNRIINLRRPGDESEFAAGVQIFELADDTALAQVATADSTGVEATNDWLLFDYAETRFLESGATARREPRVRLEFDLSPDLLQRSVVREDLLDTPALTRYIEFLAGNGMDSGRYVGAYWRRIANMVSVVFMAMLALPFVFGSLRSAGTGARMTVGIVIGLVYYVSVQLSANTGEVFELDPVIVAWAPTAALILITGITLLRVR